MKKGIARLVHLLATNQKHHITPANINAFVNTIPCAYSQYFKPSLGELYVLREMSEYPITEKDHSPATHFPFTTTEKKEVHTFSELLLNFGSELNYLELQEAKDWLKKLDIQQLKKNRRNLDLLQRYVKQNLSEKEYEGYVQQAAIEFIEEIIHAQQKINSVM